MINRCRALWTGKREVVMQWILAVLVGIIPLMVMADGLPHSVAARIERDPEKYLDDLAVLIEGFGRDGAIEAAGLHNMVAMARADARALAFRRLQGADLDGDGAIGGNEMRITAAALAAAARGRLVVNFGKADLNGDDQVTVAELQAYANAVAEQAFSADKAAAVMAIMVLDTGGDGKVTVAEARAALAQVASAKGGKREIHNQFQVEGDNHGGDDNGQPDQPVGGSQGAHLLAVRGEHHKGNDCEAELQAENHLRQDQQLPCT
jgi:hypothetical protein